MWFPAACGENVAPLAQGTLVGRESVGIEPTLSQVMPWRRSKIQTDYYAGTLTDQSHPKLSCLPVLEQGF